MGQDIHCIATWNGRRSIGTASLETEDIIFRGEFRLRIPFKTITDLNADEGRLTVRIPEGTATFNLGVPGAAVGGAHPEPEGRAR